MSNIKQTIQEIRGLMENVNVPLIDILRPWMTITELTFQDALHLTHDEAVSGLCSIYTKLGEMLDVLDDDQLQEAACRCIKQVKVYGEDITDGEVTVRTGHTLTWDGSSWKYPADPKLRQMGSSSSYREALKNVRVFIHESATL